MLDRYYSAPWWIDVLFDAPVVAHHVRQARHILEPFAGQDLSLARRMAERGHYVTTADVDKEAPVHIHGDSFSREWGYHDAVVTNPPFVVDVDGTKRQASDAVRLFVPRVRRFAAFLMRLSWMEACGDRGDILSEYPPDHVIVLQRYSFKKTLKSSTDKVTCAWFIWAAESTGLSTWKSLTKQEAERYKRRYAYDQMGRFGSLLSNGE